MTFLIYTPLRSQDVVIPDDNKGMTAEVIDCIWEKSTYDFADDGAVHLLNDENSRNLLADLANRYKKDCPSLQRFPSSLKGVGEKEGVFMINTEKSDFVSRRAAIEALHYQEAWKERYDDVKQRLTVLSVDYNFLSFGFDDMPVRVGEPDKAKRVCRFCGKSGAEKFKDEAHAIQDSLGNKLLVCNEECDECNHTLNKIEDAFLVMMDVRRSTFHISRKNSAKSARVVGENFVIEPDEKGDAHLYVMQEMLPSDTSSPFMMRLNHKTNITNENMYKALVKMVIDLIPNNELPHFENTIKWITDGNWCPDALPSLWFAENKTIYRQPVLDIFLKKDGCKRELPYCTAVLWIYDAIYMYVVPMVDVDAGRYKYDKNLTSHWTWMKAQMGNRQWYQQDGFDYTPAVVWIDVPIDTKNPYIHALPKSDALFSDSLKKKVEPELVDFPVLDTSGIHVQSPVKATFSQIYKGAVTISDLTDITIHATTPTFVLFPLKRNVKFQMGYDANDTTDKIPYFKVSINVDFLLDDFWSNLDMKLDKEGMLISCAFDYHLRDYLYEVALAESEKILTTQRAGTPFAFCKTTKLIDNKRLLDGSALMVPTNEPDRFIKVNLNYHY